MKTCFDCRCELESTGSGPEWMNSDQWDASKAGDYFRKCDKAGHPNGNCYFWDTANVPVLKRVAPEREYDPNVAPCDDAEFGMTP